MYLTHREIEEKDRSHLKLLGSSFLVYNPIFCSRDPNASRIPNKGLDILTTWAAQAVLLSSRTHSVLHEDSALSIFPSPSIPESHCSSRGDHIMLFFLFSVGVVASQGSFQKLHHVDFKCFQTEPPGTLNLY